MTEYEFTLTTWDGGTLTPPAGGPWAVYSILTFTEYMRDRVGTSHAMAVIWCKPSAGTGIGIVGSIS